MSMADFLNAGQSSESSVALWRNNLLQHETKWSANANLWTLKFVILMGGCMLPSSEVVRLTYDEHSACWSPLPTHPF